MTFREHRIYDINTPSLSLEMRVTFLTHFRAPIYPGKGSLSMLQAGGFFFFSPPSSTSSAFIQKFTPERCPAQHKSSTVRPPTSTRTASTANAHQIILTCWNRYRQSNRISFIGQECVNVQGISLIAFNYNVHAQGEKCTMMCVKAKKEQHPLTYNNDTRYFQQLNARIKTENGFKDRFTMTFNYHTRRNPS